MNGLELFIPPPAQPRWDDPALDERYYWIYVGSFFDRFGPAALSITSSEDPQVRGLVTLLLPRTYVDLRRPDLPDLVEILVVKGYIDAGQKAVALDLVTTAAERVTPALLQPAA